MAERWTVEEDATLQRLREEGLNYREIATHVKRTPQATRVRLAKVATKSRSWTEQEKNLVFKLKTEGFPASYIAKAVNRTKSAVNSFIAREWTEYCSKANIHTSEK